MAEDATLTMHPQTLWILCVTDAIATVVLVREFSKLDGRTMMVDERVESVVFSLLEHYSFEDVLDTLRTYSETQARLANLLQQFDASEEWQIQVSALDMACAALQARDALVSVDSE